MFMTIPTIVSKMFFIPIEEEQVKSKIFVSNDKILQYLIHIIDHYNSKNKINQFVFNELLLLGIFAFSRC